MRFTNFNFIPGLFIIIYHLLLITTIPLYLNMQLPSLGIILATIIMAFVFGTSISAGYHRLYAHRTYTTNKTVESIILFLGTLATEGSALQWSFDHRIHHRFVDSEKDPYSIKKGFFYAHILWIFRKQQPIDPQVVPDLTTNRLVLFQHRWYPYLLFVSNLLVFSLFGFIFNDFFGSFVFCFLLRTFLVHHLTWFINSLAHSWGSQIYSKEHSAVDNYIISLLTFGEGYHNYHHTFASDYRNGVKWYHFDTSKWLIWILSKIHLTKNLIKINQYTIKHRLIQQDKILAINKIKNSFYVNKELLQKKVYEISERINSTLSSLKEMKKQFLVAKKQHAKKEYLTLLRVQFKEQKRILRKDWHTWCDIIHYVMTLT